MTDLVEDKILIYYSLFKQIGPVVLVGNLYTWYQNLKLDNLTLGQIEMVEKINTLLEQYKTVPIDLLKILKRLNLALPFDVDYKEIRSIFDILLNLEKESEWTIKVKYQISHKISFHSQYDRNMIIRQLDPTFIHDFSIDDLNIIIEKIKLDNKPTDDLLILNQRQRIEQLIKIRKQQFEHKTDYQPGIMKTLCTGLLDQRRKNSQEKLSEIISKQSVGQSMLVSSNQRWRSESFSGLY